MPSLEDDIQNQNSNSQSNSMQGCGQTCVFLGCIILVWFWNDFAQQTISVSLLSGILMYLSDFIWILPFLPIFSEKIKPNLGIYCFIGIIVQSILCCMAHDEKYFILIPLYCIVFATIITSFIIMREHDDSKINIYRKRLIFALKNRYTIAKLREYVINLNIPIIKNINSDVLTLELMETDSNFNSYYNEISDEYIARECESNNKIILNSFYNSTPVEIKERLYNTYDIDIAVIDNIVKSLENEFDESIQEGLEKKKYIPNLKATQVKEVMNKVTNEVNKVHSNRLYDMESILDFGIYSATPLNTEKLEIRKKNLKYYKVDEHYTHCSNETEYYFSQILFNSIYPSFVSKEFELEYNDENNILIINYTLPNVEDLPQIQKIKYHSTNRELLNIEYKEKDIEEIYSNVIYQIVLRTLYEIFVSDSNNLVSSVVFNGVLNFTDKSDGKDKSAYTVSIQAGKAEFLDINLDKVDPKQCFRRLRGVSGASLYNIVPIRPIINLNKEDKRFVEATDIIDEIDEGYNLATMDWKEFEYLVREIFEKEFSKNGGEVKVTQSSRDGGVDAIAFDPDPIRGGKIVIQAKRYTNVVGVSAVRDLYGTVMNEGATKGILVTTSNFGKDSYDFAKDKPLTLLNGANLLALLENHGYKARIDINEAKKNIK